VNALSSVRVDSGCAALSGAAARRFAPASLALFDNNVERLRVTRGTICADILRGRKGTRSQTRLAYHALQTTDKSLRSHVCEACRCEAEDFALHHKARTFELQQLCANNVISMPPVSEDILAFTSVLLKGLLAPPCSAMGALFHSPLACSLYAAAVLRALPHNAFQLATRTNFSYFRPNMSRALLACPVAESLLQKVETGEQHGIIPPILSTHICNIIKGGALDCNMQSLHKVFDSDMHPLLSSAVNSITSKSTYLSLDSPENRTEYQATGTRSYVLNILSER